MDIAHAAAKSGSPEGLVIAANEQTAGRGRVGNIWFSPKGESVYTSILLRPSLCAQQINWLTMIGALAVCDVVDQLNGAHARIKWFNDVQLNGRKLAGVLVECAFVGDAIDYAILGIGINVNTHFDAAPREVRERAISLRDVFARDFDRDAILNDLLSRLDTRYMQMTNGISPRADYLAKLDTLGKSVRVSSGKRLIEGVAQSIDEFGALIIETANGRQRIAHGDVIN